jgi:hypothetical protein
MQNNYSKLYVDLITEAKIVWKKIVGLKTLLKINND